MNPESTTQTVLFDTLFSKPVVVRMDQTQSSSDRGGLLLKSFDEHLGLTEVLADALHGPRQPGKVAHTSLDLLRQWVYGIALDYPDGNDASALGQDHIHKLLLERARCTGDSLGSQPTLS